MLKQLTGRAILQKIYFSNIQNIRYKKFYHQLQTNSADKIFEDLSFYLKNNIYFSKLYLQPHNSYSQEKTPTIKSDTNVQNCIEDINPVTILAESHPKLPVSLEEGDWDSEMQWIKTHEKSDLLSEPSCPSEIDNVSTALRPTYNLAAYVNRSETLQKLVDLGVDLNRLEKRRGIADLILKLDFEVDMKDHITFLYDAGVDVSDLGRFITINPLIFNNSLEDLQARLTYLESKHFLKKEISRVISRNPYWLQFSTFRVDGRLGFFQRTFELTGSEVRHLATRQPKLITHNLHHIKRTTFAIKEEMGFDSMETKQLLLALPKIWMSDGAALLRRFDFVHTQMDLQHSQIIEFPQLLGQRDFRLHQRHSFLKALGRNQYDPTKPGYISPLTMVEGNDLHFSINCAKTSVQAFNDFCKTI